MTETKKAENLSPINLPSTSYQFDIACVFSLQEFSIFKILAPFHILQNKVLIDKLSKIISKIIKVGKFQCKKMKKLIILKPKILRAIFFSVVLFIL